MPKVDDLIAKRPRLPEWSPSRAEYVDLMGYADDLEEALREAGDLLARWVTPEKDMTCSDQDALGIHLYDETLVWLDGEKEGSAERVVTRVRSRHRLPPLPADFDGDGAESGEPCAACTANRANGLSEAETSERHAAALRRHGGADNAEEER